MRRRKTKRARQEKYKREDGANKNYTMVAVTFTANNTRMPGGQSAAPNCRFEASVAVPLEDSLAASCRLCGNFGSA